MPRYPGQALTVPRSEDGSAYLFYVDGDVDIEVGDMIYRVHSSIMRNNSPLLTELLAPSRRAQLHQELADECLTASYKLALVEAESAQSEPCLVLKFIELGSDGKPKNEEPPPLRDLDDMPHKKSISVAYDSIFGTFYNMPISLGAGTDISVTQGNAFALIIVAEYLQCVHSVTTVIEASLLAFGPILYKEISQTPGRWLELGYRSRSRPIYREALVHAAGLFKTQTIQAAVTSGMLHNDVVKILEAKYNFIQESVRRSERFIASYYPSMLMRTATVGMVNGSNMGRASYSNDILMWMALTVFRHYISDQQAMDSAHTAEDQGFGLMKALLKGGQAYLPRTAMVADFHGRFPMSPKCINAVEHRLNEIKEAIKHWVEPLFAVTTSVNVERYPLNHFAFIHLNTDDYPFLTEDFNPAALNAKPTEADERPKPTKMKRKWDDLGCNDERPEPRSSNKMGPFHMESEDDNDAEEIASSHSRKKSQPTAGVNQRDKFHGYEIVDEKTYAGPVEDAAPDSEIKREEADDEVMLPEWNDVPVVGDIDPSFWDARPT